MKIYVRRSLISWNEEAENAIDVDGLINFEHRHKPRGSSVVRIMAMTTTKTKFRTSFVVDVVYRKIRQLALASYLVKHKNGLKKWEGKSNRVEHTC